MNANVYDERTLPRPLPVGKAGHHTGGWWGMLALIGTETSVFAYLLFSYFYLQSQHAQTWPPTGLPPMRYSIPVTCCLIASAGTMWWAEHSARIGRRPFLLVALLVTLLLGVAYVVLQFLDWQIEPFTISSGAYASLFFLITAAHVLHAIVGGFILIAMIIWSAMGHIAEQRFGAIDIAAMYWYFIVGIWIAVFITLYILPYIGPG